MTETETEPQTQPQTQTQTQILVTGGAGFIGSHLCEALTADPDTFVYCLDNLSSGRAPNVPYEETPNLLLLEADACDPHVWDSLPAVDQVYYLASRASPEDFDRHPLEIADANTVGLRHALEYAQTVDARLLYTSTSEIYGDPEVHPQPETYTGNVRTRGPRSCYDESKRFGETLASVYATAGVDARTVRIFNTYGPRMRPDDGRVIPTFVTQALAGAPLTVYGDGSQTRSFCYVDDLVRGLQRVMNAPDPAYGVYNLGADDERTINDLAQMICDLTDHGGHVTHTPLPTDDPTQRRPDLTRMQSDLGWEPQTDLETGLARTIEAFDGVG